MHAARLEMEAGNPKPPAYALNHIGLRRVFWMVLLEMARIILSRKPTHQRIV